MRNLILQNSVLGFFSVIGMQDAFWESVTVLGLRWQTLPS